MDFLYFPEDKTEYIPGIISVIVIFILSMLIIWLLVRASRKQVKQLDEQGYSVAYQDENAERDSLIIDDQPTKEEEDGEIDRNRKKKS